MNKTTNQNKFILHQLHLKRAPKLKENLRLRRKQAKKSKSKKFKSVRKRTESNEVLPVQVLPVQVLHQAHRLHQNLRTKEEGEGKEKKKVLVRRTEETESRSPDRKKEETRDKEKI